MLHLRSSNWVLPTKEFEVELLCRTFKVVTRPNPVIHRYTQVFIDKVKIGNCVGEYTEKDYDCWTVLSDSKHNFIGEEIQPSIVIEGVVSEVFAIGNLLRLHLERGVRTV